MKVIGLLGGMSWESTVTYYQILNRVINEKLGGLHSARLLLYSVDFQEIEWCQKQDQWDKSAIILSEAARALEKGGADCLIICTNTMHKVADQIQKAISIPLLHIADMTVEVLKEAGLKKIGLLGTSYTMEQDFYKKRIEAHNIQVIVPDADDRIQINRIIFEELCHGRIYPESKQIYLSVINHLKNKGVEGIILGCTEIGLLLNQKDTDVPLFDTTRIHAQKAALFALKS